MLRCITDRQHPTGLEASQQPMERCSTDRQRRPREKVKVHQTSLTSTASGRKGGAQRRALSATCRALKAAASVRYVATLCGRLTARGTGSAVLREPLLEASLIDVQAPANADDAFGKAVVFSSVNPPPQATLGE